MLHELSSPNALALPDFEAAITGSRKFRLVMDASADGLGVVIEQQEIDGSIRPLRFLERVTLDNERKWSISEIECAAIVRAIKRNRQMFYGIRFEVETDHEILQDCRGRFLDSWMAQTADAAYTQLRVQPLPRTGDKDEADGSRRLRQSKS